jgi:glycosyltransferase involved in cell wall biosynthesis
VINGCYNDSILKSAFVNNFRHKTNQFESEIFTNYVAISTTIKNYLLDLGVDDNKITVINNPVSSQNRITQNASEVFFAGRLEEEKGVLTALDTWEKFPKLPMLNILGSGSLSNIVESRAEKSANVTFFGPKFGVDFDSISQRCKVALILNSWEEPFGRTFAEALSRGQAIVSTSSGNALSFLQTGVNGFCVSPDPADIAHKVELAMELSIDRHATYGRNLWKNEYSEEAVALQWEKFHGSFHQK